MEVWLARAFWQFISIDAVVTNSLGVVTHSERTGLGSAASLSQGAHTERGNRRRFGLGHQHPQSNPASPQVLQGLQGAHWCTGCPNRQDVERQRLRVFARVPRS